MASILMNTLRTQTRVALIASKARVSPSTATFFGLVSRQSARFLAPAVQARALSTSHVVREEYDDLRVPKANSPTDTLYVGNMPFSIDIEDLRELFAIYGDIKDIRISQHFLCFLLSPIFSRGP
jgi:hypothetical protein